MSEKIWQTLTSGGEGHHDPAAKIGGEAMTKAGDDLEKQGLEIMKQHGLTISEPDREAFKEALKDIYKTLRRQALAGRVGGQDPGDAEVACRRAGRITNHESRITAFMLKLLRIAERIWELSIAAMVAGLLVVVASQVVDRYVIDLWTDSPEEWIKIGLVWLTFIGFALAMRHGTDIRVDLVDHFLPRKLLLVVNTVFDSLLLVLIGILCFKTGSSGMCPETRRSSARACRWRCLRRDC